MPWRKGNRLRTVAEADADPETRRIYAEIKAALGFPGLQLYYPALGVYPVFLALHWRTVQRLTAGQELFLAAERLLADAYTRTHNYFRIPNLSSQVSVDYASRLANEADYYQLHGALLLLLFSFQIQAMDGPAGLANVASTPHQPKALIDHLPASADEQSASPRLRKCFEEIRRTLGTPFVSPELSAFATEPEFFDSYWRTLKQMMASPLYAECKYGVRSTAWSAAAQLPGPAEVTLDAVTDAGLSPQDVASAARILELFVASLSGQLLNVAVAKIALEGGNLAAEEPRPSTRGRTQPAA